MIMVRPVYPQGRYVPGLQLFLSADRMASPRCYRGLVCVGPLALSMFVLHAAVGQIPIEPELIAEVWSVALTCPG